MQQVLRRLHPGGSDEFVKVFRHILVGEVLICLATANHRGGSFCGSAMIDRPSVTP